MNALDREYKFGASGVGLEDVTLKNMQEMITKNFSRHKELQIKMKLV